MLEALKTERMNKLIYMVSQCDQCMSLGYDYEPDDRDIKRIEQLDTVINVLYEED